MPPDRPAPPKIIPFYSLRLADLVSEKAVIVLQCRACRREGRLDVIPVLARRGPNFGVRELEGVVTCAECGRKGFAMVRVEWL